jgi:hypothetical protein
MFASGKAASVSAEANYIEDVFSTYLYTGNSSTQTITNGIDLSGKGGMTWLKCRNNTFYNSLYDTVRGATKVLYSNDTLAEQTYTGVTSFDSTGFTLGSTAGNNGSPYLFASWTFRKQPKFFDVVTYTGNGSVSEYQAINHLLGSNPACIILKRTDTTSNWIVLHQQDGGSYYGAFRLNTTGARLTQYLKANYPFSTTQFPAIDVSGSTGNAADNMNASGGTYVAYVFASDAGGFGLTGTDNVISCGSFTSDIAGVDINLGYEPQWVMVKVTNGVGLGWYIWDNMRGFVVSTSGGKTLEANSTSTESNTNWISPTATGFKLNAGQIGTGNPFIYIAIRRGPMKVPTDATKVFNPVLAASDAPALRSSNFTSGVDSGIHFYTPGYTGYPRWSSRLTGTGVLATSSTAAESTVSVNTWDYMNGYFNYAGLGTDQGAWMFKRAPSFFDEVCYTASGSSIKNHNLGVAPEFIITKSRNLAQNWIVTANLGANGKQFTAINTSAATYSDNFSSYATATTIDTSVFAFNDVGYNYVAYLFATCAGVSKVGSYTGTGALQTVNCGFAAGARFVLIKRTDSTGDWYVWDSARGIVSGNDPYLLLNSTAAEVTNTDYVDTYSAGFEISSTAPAAINASGGTFIFLAIA